MDLSEMSSCSSECDCYLCQYGMGCQNVQQGPFYATMGQPLVYFAAEVPGQKKEKKPNCFIRAFRWYTEEHSPPFMTLAHDRVPKSYSRNPSAPAPPDPKVTEFAAWLDSKYEEYLHENVDPNACCVKRTATSIIESCTPVQRSQETGGTPGDPCCAKKKFGRIKSPWKKRRDRSKSKDKTKSSGDEKTAQSMEYIMHPKELSRAASECCHNTPTSCCSVMVKSQSLTSVAKISQEGEKSVKLDQPPIEKKSLSRTATREIIRQGSDLKKPKDNNVSCQCFVNVDRNDVETQYYTSEPDSSCCRSAPSNADSTASTPQEKKNRQRSANKKKKSSLSARQSDASCQCCCEAKVDAYVQHQDTVMSVCAYPAPRENCLECHCVTCHEILYSARLNQRAADMTMAPPTSQNVIISAAPSTTGKCSINCPYNNSKGVATAPATPVETKTQSTVTAPCACKSLAEDEVQTSDHSIALDAAVHESFYMKIVCMNR